MKWTWKLAAVALVFALIGGYFKEKGMQKDIQAAGPKLEASCLRVVENGNNTQVQENKHDICRCTRETALQALGGLRAVAVVQGRGSAEDKVVVQKSVASCVERFTS
ncbi:MAG: hypothetical protein REI94_07075 [Moraxellaceae bacterium]|nr:hypothetical protein [Moraxellaceae bacterium]